MPEFELPSFVRSRINMAQGEVVKYLYRRHHFWLFRRVIPPILLALLIFVAGFALNGPAVPILMLIAAVLLPAVISMIKWQRRVFVITDRRMMLLGGIIVRFSGIDESPLQRVSNTDYGPHGQLVYDKESKEWSINKSLRTLRTMLCGLVGETDYMLQFGDSNATITLVSFPSGITGDLSAVMSVHAPVQAAGVAHGEAQDDNGSRVDATGQEF